MDVLRSPAEDRLSVIKNGRCQMIPAGFQAAGLPLPPHMSSLELTSTPIHRANFWLSALKDKKWELCAYKCQPMVKELSVHLMDEPLPSLSTPSSLWLSSPVS